jgi:divalent metal cation (Fe/Co/Zn/Cd) transporter
MAHVSSMISGMILLVVATGVLASAIARMLNDGRRLPPSHLAGRNDAGEPCASSPAISAINGGP